MSTLAGIVMAAVLGVALGVGATFAIVQTNAPDKAIEATFNSNDVKERDVVPYGQR